MTEAPQAAAPEAEPENEVPEVLAALSVRKRLFVEAFVGEARGVGYLAAQLAGYSGDKATLMQTAHRLLRTAEIRNAVSELLEHTPFVCSRVERLQRLTEIARGIAREDRVTRDGRVLQVRVSVQLQLRALETLCKLAGDEHAEQLGGDEERTILCYPMPAPHGAEPAQLDQMWRAHGIRWRSRDDDDDGELDS